MSELIRPKERRLSVADMFPTDKDWDDAQGGRSGVFYNPKNPYDKGWTVLHVYDQHEDPAKKFANGSILPTMPPKGNIVDFVDLSIDNKDPQGPKRTVRVPSMMVYKLHGGPCSERSGKYNSSSYDKIKSEEDYIEYKVQMARAGMWELKYDLVGDKLMFIPQSINV